MINNIIISNKKIGINQPPFIIGELSGNHNGNIKRAIKLLKIAKSANVSAVKIQTYTPDTLTIKCDKPDFLINEGVWKGKTLYDLYKEAYTPWEWHEKIFSEAKKLGIIIFSTPFDETAVDFLEELNCPAYKIASFEIIDHQLLEKVSLTKKPIILSTGMANLHEIEEAVKILKKNKVKNYALLHCVSGYPTPPNEANLKTIIDLSKRFQVPIGLSDHTLGINVSICAIALGATIIEKHFTISRKDKGPDSSFSLEPSELSDLTSSCKEAWDAIGNINYKIKESEKENLKFRRSLYVIENINKGNLLTKNNIKSIRPGYGMHPKELENVIGKKATRNLIKGHPLITKDFI